MMPFNNTKVQHVQLDRSPLSLVCHHVSPCRQVRFASVEALAVAANVWSGEALDVSDVLEHAKLLRFGLQCTKLGDQVKRLRLDGAGSEI